ncbi:hypothetical protein GIV64_25815, partial [Pseudomonas syringae]|nr:hypothetical protein [Pseudomonas syringae]
PDQRQDSAVTYVALCVASAIAIKKRFYVQSQRARHGAMHESRLDLCITMSAPRGDAVRDAPRHTAVL